MHWISRQVGKQWIISFFRFRIKTLLGAGWLSGTLRWSCWDREMGTLDKSASRWVSFCCWNPLLRRGLDNDRSTARVIPRLHRNSQLRPLWSGWERFKYPPCWCSPSARCLTDRRLSLSPDRRGDTVSCAPSCIGCWGFLRDQWGRVTRACPRKGSPWRLLWGLSCFGETIWFWKGSLLW